MQGQNPSEASIQAAIAAQLDADAQAISLAQRMRLDEARARALVHASAPVRRNVWFGISPSALLGASAAVLLALGVHFWGNAERAREQEVLLSMWEAPAQVDTTEQLSPLEVAILADDEQAQVLDNLEFYAWLAEQERVAAGAPSGS